MQDIHEEKKNKKKKNALTVAFFRAITRQQLHFHRWSKWVPVFYCDPLGVPLSTERKHLSGPPVLWLILIPRLWLSLPNFWFSIEM